MCVCVRVSQCIIYIFSLCDLLGVSLLELGECAMILYSWQLFIVVPVISSKLLCDFKFCTKRLSSYKLSLDNLSRGDDKAKLVEETQQDNVFIIASLDLRCNYYTIVAS